MAYFKSGRKSFCVVFGSQTTLLISDSHGNNFFDKSDSFFGVGADTLTVLRLFCNELSNSIVKFIASCRVDSTVTSLILIHGQSHSAVYTRGLNFNFFKNLKILELSTL